MYTAILNNLQKAYETTPNATKKQQMEAYMRNQFTFYGVPKPERTAIERPFLKELLFLQNPDLAAIAHALWNKPQREFHYFCITYLEKVHKHWTKDTLLLFETLITTHSWWDSVDTIADHLVGKLLRQYPELVAPATARWNQSGNIWLQRTAIIFQLKYKADTDEDLLFHNILQHSASKEFFLQKAIGWALRQHRYTNPAVVDTFVASHKLAPLSVREALKHVK